MTHGAQRAACALLLVALALAPPLASHGASASGTKPVSEDLTLRSGDSSFLALYNVWPPEDTEIDVAWNSTVPIDVWYLDRAQFDRFDAGENFTWDLAQSGTSGAVRANVSAARQAAVNGSMYLAFENGARGNTTPPANTSNATARVHVQGKLWTPDPVYAASQGDPLWFTAIELGALLTPVVIIALVVVRRIRRKERRAQIRDELRAGNVVGEGAAQAPETVTPTPLQAPPPRGPPGAQPPAYVAAPFGAPPYAPQAVGQQPYLSRANAPAPPAQCRNCGAPRTSAAPFCGHCGAPL